MNILILSGHPRQQSFTHALSKAYQEGAQLAGAQTSLVSLSNIQLGNQTDSPLPSQSSWTADMKALWQEMKAADHVVIAHPLWWGSMPGELKMLFDRLLVSGTAYQYQQGKAFPKGLLADRTAELIMTSDTPDWYYRFGYCSAQTNLMKNQILKFIGLKPVRSTHISPVRNMSDIARAKKLEQVKNMAFKYSSRQQKSAA
ncbi:NAD(P)H-dependent oxidoreductase [Maritalea porphyrae]|jgi:NAD(P)H dehydrogenase (quinone)|uniref:NAD(P)H-dependent oxidoreductase n=1 Tax=Maritalea porphyrae TaxID=880732 RepID=UPI0022AF8D08|nr:NAD(P)H-dependent oxidoreductase [Maritalea porphyrae]MCZ4272317.1 NAD(P)H-dependent oxidoreductase [Maritalea porphyrae]